MMPPFEESWDRYAKHCLRGIDPNSIQYKDTKRAFYAGAFSFHNRADVISQLPEEVGAHLYGRMLEEVQEFIKGQIKQDVERN